MIEILASPWMSSGICGMPWVLGLYLALPIIPKWMGKKKVPFHTIEQANRLGSAGVKRAAGAFVTVTVPSAPRCGPPNCTPR